MRLPAYLRTHATHASIIAVELPLPRHNPKQDSSASATRSCAQSGSEMIPLS